MFSKSKLDEVLPSFITYLTGKNCNEDYLMYEIQHHWTQNWNLEDIRLNETYDFSLQSTISNRLWRTSDYDPKDMMIKFLNFDKEMVRVMFRDLFNESKPIDLRIQRFSYHCDEIFAELRRSQPTKKLRSHYHDHPMISLYLFLNNPSKYLYFEEDNFVQGMLKLGARNVSKPVGIESYYKVGALLGKFQHEHENLSLLIEKKLSERKIKYIRSNAIVTIFMNWLVKN
jgi:hypothetical protein